MHLMEFIPSATSSAIFTLAFGLILSFTILLTEPAALPIAPVTPATALVVAAFL